MVKRKVSTNGDVNTTKKPKSKTSEYGKIDTSGPEDAITSLLAPTSLTTFQKNHWEKKFLHVKRKDKGIILHYIFLKFFSAWVLLWNLSYSLFRFLWKPFLIGNNERDVRGT